MTLRDVRYLVFDVESASDGALISKVRYREDRLSPEQAIARYRAELIEEAGSDFIPYTFQFPISIIVAKVAADFQLLDIVTLDDGAFRPHVMVERFWRGWETYGRPTLVTFNGRSFDIPLLELAAFRYGLALPGWFDLTARAYEQPRNRYNTAAHLDLQDILVNFGATRFNGGLNLAASMLGLPGKMDVQGFMVQDMYDAGQIADINDYCVCDVLDTYFVFLRTQVLLGKLTLEKERELVASTRNWLEGRADEAKSFRMYLAQWSGWSNPWDKAAEATCPDSRSESQPASLFKP